MKINLFLLICTFLALPVSTLANPCEEFQNESLDYKRCLHDFYTKEVTKPVIQKSVRGREIASVGKALTERERLDSLEEDFLNY